MSAMNGSFNASPTGLRKCGRAGEARIGSVTMKASSLLFSSEFA